MSKSAAPGGGSPFVPALVVGAVLAGFLALIAYVVLGAYESDFQDGDDGGAHALSKSAVGFSGLVVLLNDIGRPATIARGDVAGAGMQNAIMILTIDHGDPTTDLSELATTRTFPGPVLEVLPKWETQPTLHRGWVEKTGLRQVDVDTWIGPGPPPEAGQTSDSDAQKPADATADKNRPKIEFANVVGKARHVLHYAGADATSVQVATGEIENFRTFKSAPGWKPIIVDETGATVLAESERGSAFALSDPDLINNHGIADLDTARAGLYVLSAVSPQGPVFFDVTLNGFERARSALKLMFQPPFLAATLCAIAAALLMIWHAAVRFGAARRVARELAMGKQVLADNQAGLIRMAHREHRMGGRYATVVRSLAARAVGAPRDLAGSALDAFLDRLGEKGRTTERLSQLHAAAEQAGNNTELMDAAARLHRWRLEMTRESN